MNNTKYDINADQVNRILINCNKIPFADILPDELSTILENAGQHIGTNVPFILCPLIAATGLMLYHSTAQPYEMSKQGICNFTALIAHPSTGKSPALSLVKNAVVKVETYLEIEPQKSCLTNSASVEGLLEHLNSIPCMIAFYDESQTFLGTIGRYSTGGSGALYERSIYLTLFSATEYLERDIKCKRSRIVRPRFHMSLNGHPFYFINLLRSERNSYDDGLFQRFLVCAPKPPYISAAQMRATPKPKITLHCMFYFVHCLHFGQRHNYTFEKAALDIIDIEYDLAKNRVMIANEFDSFFGASIGKTITLMVRLAMCIKALKTAVISISNLPNVDNDNITPQFAKACEELILTLPAQTFIIDVDTVRRAKKLLDYFNLNKLILSSYAIDPYGSFDEAFDKICEVRPKIEYLSPYFASLNSKIRRFMKRAFQIKATKMNASKLSFNNLNCEEAQFVFNELEQMQLGRISNNQAKNKLWVNYFTRCSSHDLLNNPQLGENILGMGLNLTAVIEILQETEELDKKKQKELNANSKRQSSSSSAGSYATCSSESGDMSPKRRKLAKNKKGSKAIVYDKQHGGIPIIKEKIRAIVDQYEYTSDNDMPPMSIDSGRATNEIENDNYDSEQLLTETEEAHTDSEILSNESQNEHVDIEEQGNGSSDSKLTAGHTNMVKGTSSNHTIINQAKLLPKTVSKISLTAVEPTRSPKSKKKKSSLTESATYEQESTQVDIEPETTQSDSSKTNTSKRGRGRPPGAKTNKSSTPHQMITRSSSNERESSSDSIGKHQRARINSPNNKVKLKSSKSQSNIKIGNNKQPGQSSRSVSDSENEASFPNNQKGMSQSQTTQATSQKNKNIAQKSVNTTKKVSNKSIEENKRRSFSPDRSEVSQAERQNVTRRTANIKSKKLSNEKNMPYDL